MSNIIDTIQVSGVTYTIAGSGSGNSVVEVTQAQYDALVSGGTVDPTALYIITDAQAGDLTQYWTSAQTQSAITEATSGKVDSSSVVSSVTSASTDSEIPTAKAVYESVSGKVDTSSMSGYVTTNTKQEITGNKTFIGSSNTSEKPIIFKQVNDNHKIGFVCRNTASTNNELATFEFRPNTFTIDNVQHPLMYFGHYRNTNTANAGVPQTVIGFRQYDQANSAAYHMLAPLPEKAKTPFSLTTTFQDFYMPLGFKNGSTIIKTDQTGVADFSDVLGGLKLVKLTESEYTALVTKDSDTLYVVVPDPSN